MHVKIRKLQNAITFGSVVRLGCIFFLFHITFRDLRSPNAEGDLPQFFRQIPLIFRDMEFFSFFPIIFLFFKLFFPIMVYQG